MTTERIPAGNLYTGIPAPGGDEWFEALWRSDTVRIERIVSRGHCSADDFWFDQPWDEWVVLVKGRAGLEWAETGEVTELTPGDWLLIPAGVKHRVAWTASGMQTIWLAVHMASATGEKTTT